MCVGGVGGCGFVRVCACVGQFVLYCSVGSCMVLDAESLNDTVSFHHRKEEISDVKFSPSKLNGSYVRFHIVSVTLQ